MNTTTTWHEHAYDPAKDLNMSGQEMKAYFPPNGDLDHWWSCENFKKEVFRRAKHMYTGYASFNPDQAESRIRTITGRKYLGCFNRPKYQVPDGWKLFLTEINEDAQGFKDYHDYEVAMTRAGVNPMKFDNWPVHTYANALVWANAMLKRSNIEDHTSLPETIEELLEQQKVGSDMENMQVKLQQLLGNWRYDAGMERTPGMSETEHILSTILGDNTVSQFFANGGTYDEAVAKLKAHFEPLVAAHEAAKAEQPPKPLDKFIPRDADNQPKEDDKATCPICQGTGEQDGRKCSLCNGDGWVWKSELDGEPTIPNRSMNDPKPKSIGAEDESTEPTPLNDWIADKGKRVNFWASVENIIGKEHKAHILNGYKDKEAFVHDVLGVDKMRFWDGSSAEALKRVKSQVDAILGNVIKNAIAPNEKATPSNDDAISGEVVSETPKSAQNKPSGNEQPKALTIPDKQVAQYQPNPYWLTSPQWQVSPFEMAKFVAESKLFKNADTAPKALAIIFKGIEIGIGPMAALEHLNIIDGKPPSSDGSLMLALLRKSGISVEFLERTDKICRLKMTRPDNGNSIIQQFTIEEAQKAGLTNKPNWRYPRAMLTWRAVSEAAKLIASDLMIMGGIPMYTHEEINPDAILNEDGTVAA